MTNNKTDVYVELARISATLLAALFALMAFMLVVGVQNPANNIEVLLYVVTGSLGLNLVLFAAGNLLAEYSGRLLEASRQKGAREALKPKNDKIAKLLGRFRIVQQAAFVLSIAAVVWLSVAFTQFFYKPAPPAPQPSAQSSQEQMPDETPEQHAAEGSGQPAP